MSVRGPSGSAPGIIEGQPWSTMPGSTSPWNGAACAWWMGGFYAKCDSGGVRLGRAGRGRQVLLEDLARGPVTEAAARGVVEPVGQPPQAGAVERLGRALARQEAADAA